MHKKFIFFSLNLVSLSLGGLLHPVYAQTPILITNNVVTDRFIDPKRSQTTVIQYTLSVNSDVTIKIYNQQSQALVRTLILNQPRLAGANSENFDGKNDLGQNLNPVVYIYKITATNTGGGSGSYDPVFTPGTGSALLNFNINPASNFSPFKGDRFAINYYLPEPAVVSLGATGQSNFLTQQPRDTGNHTDYWDGRESNGQITTSTLNIQAVTESLPQNFIVIQDETTLNITPLTTNPYLIRPLYKESTQIAYTINESATVTVSIISEDGSQVLKTLEQAIVKSAGSYTVVWDGQTSSGETIAEDGNYRIRVQAIDALGHNVTRDGNIKIQF